MSSIPGWGRSPGGGHSNPLQYSCLENPWREVPGGLQAIDSCRELDMTQVTKHAQVSPGEKQGPNGKKK